MWEVRNGSMINRSAVETKHRSSGVSFPGYKAGYKLHYSLVHSIFIPMKNVGPYDMGFQL